MQEENSSSESDFSNKGEWTLHDWRQERNEMIVKEIRKQTNEEQAWWAQKKRDDKEAIIKQQEKK